MQLQSFWAGNQHFWWYSTPVEAHCRHSLCFSLATLLCDCIWQQLGALVGIPLRALELLSWLEVAAPLDIPRLHCLRISFPFVRQADRQLRWHSLPIECCSYDYRQCLISQRLCLETGKAYQQLVRMLLFMKYHLLLRESISLLSLRSVSVSLQLCFNNQEVAIGESSIRLNAYTHKMDVYVDKEQWRQ